MIHLHNNQIDCVNGSSKANISFVERKFRPNSLEFDFHEHNSIKRNAYGCWNLQFETKTEINAIN